MAKSQGLSPADRRRIVEWAKEAIGEERMHQEYGAIFVEISATAMRLSMLLNELNRPAKMMEEDVKRFCDGATLTDGVNWLEECLRRVIEANAPRTQGVPGSPQHWAHILGFLSFAAEMGGSPPKKTGTFQKIGPDGKPTGPAWNMNDGSEVDNRGRKERRPTLRRLIFELLNLTNGTLSFEKNTGKGSLADALKDLRADLPDIIPAALPNSTIQTIKTEWRQRQANRTRKARLRLVK